MSGPFSFAVRLVEWGDVIVALGGPPVVWSEICGRMGKRLTRGPRVATTTP